MSDDFGLPGPLHARRRDALRQYAGDVAALAEAEAMPERKRQAKDANALWVQGLDKARARVRDADARMGDPCRRVVRRVACRGEGAAVVAVELGYDGPDVVRALLAAGAAEIARVYEVRAAA